MKPIPIIAVLSLPLLLAATPLESPKQKGEMKNAPMKLQPAVRAAPPRIEQAILTWTYPLSLPRTGLVFDIQHRENLRSGSWAKVGETTAPPFAYTITSKKTGFFRVISRSTSTNSVVKLAWDASPDDAVAHYRLYTGGVSRSYTNFVSADGLSATVSNLTGRTFFAATALTSAGQESVFSNEVDYTPPSSEPVFPVTSLTITTL